MVLKSFIIKNIGEKSHFCKKILLLTKVDLDLVLSIFFST